MHAPTKPSVVGLHMYDFIPQLKNSVLVHIYIYKTYTFRLYSLVTNRFKILESIKILKLVNYLAKHISNSFAKKKKHVSNFG